MTPQIAIPPGADLMTYDEFAECYGYCIRTVKQMVADGDLLLMPRKKTVVQRVSIWLPSVLDSWLRVSIAAMWQPEQLDYLR